MGPTRVCCLVFAVALAGCHDDPVQEAPSRFAAVKNERALDAAKSFCEQTFPTNGGGARKWSAPPERDVPGPSKAPSEPGKPAWTWVNLWASWCQPCVKEMPLLGRWGRTLNDEGIPVRFEFWSIDESEDELRGALNREIPGRVRWLRAQSDLTGFLESLGVNKDSAIPIHALVDRSGQLRCVRVGSVGEEVYGSVKALLAGG